MQKQRQKKVLEKPVKESLAEESFVSCMKLSCCRQGTAKGRLQELK